MIDVKVLLRLTHSAALEFPPQMGEAPLAIAPALAQSQQINLGLNV
jgi:hypothetical protein